MIQNRLDPNLRVVIVVPTIVLLHQWYEEILEHGNLPAEAIARLGGGYSDEFAPHTRTILRRIPRFCTARRKTVGTPWRK